MRNHYHVDTMSNFFTCVSINANVLDKNYINFEYILAGVRNEFKNKLTNDE